MKNLNTLPLERLFNSAFIQPSKLEFKIIGSIYTLPHYKYPQVSDGKK